MTRLGIAQALGLALAFTLTLNLAACGRDTGPAPAVPAATTAAIGSTTSAGAGRDTSLPDASSTFAAQEAALRAKALQDAAAALNDSGPPSTMSKEQESKTMPLPGQANDHSTAARDDKRKGPPAN